MLLLSTFIFLSILTTEVLLYFIILKYRKKFQWFITKEDLVPEFPADVIKKYISTSFDPYIGWLRKPETEGIDLSPEGNASFTINSKGARMNPDFENQPPRICAFGDSYTFCRLVNDNETWPYYYSHQIDAYVENYGVGNYGLDQVILRLERQINKIDAKNIIVGIVPETIIRIHSYWKHYFEYGNILAFKPMYKKNRQGNYELKETIIRNENDFYRISELLEEIQKNDYFYNSKFKKEILKFPFLLNIFFSNNIYALFELIKGDITGNHEDAYEKAFSFIIRKNYKYQQDLYNNKSAVELLEFLIKKYKDICDKNNKNALLLIIPQPIDLEYAMDGETQYCRVFEGFKNILDVVDLTQVFLNEDTNKMYKKGKLGTHVSNYGNKLIANYLTSNYVLD